MDARSFMASDRPRPSVYTPFLRRFTDEPARDLAETIALYHEVERMHRGSVWAQDDMVDRVNGHCVEILDKLVSLPKYSPILQALDRCQIAVIRQESTIVSFQEIDWSRARLSMKEQVDLRRFLRAKQHFLANEDRVFELLVNALCNVFGGIIQSLPEFANDDNPTLTVPLISLLGDPRDTVDKVIGTLFGERLADAGLFTAIQLRIYENQCHASGVVPFEETKRPLVRACESELAPEELIETYLTGTPFLELFRTSVPFVLPESARLEHHWIVGGTGHEKQTLLRGSSLTIYNASRTARRLS
jgi:hypothetical protein